MITLSEVKEMLRSISPPEVLMEISEGSRFHRIQGTWELVESMKWLKGKLEERGIEARILEYDPKHANEMGMRVPRWKLKYAELEVKIGHETEHLSTDDNLLLATPHTPSGESEGEVSIVNSYKEVDEEHSGKILLAIRDQRLVYYVSKSVGVSGVIFSREHQHEYVFPYFGLFFDEKFLEDAPVSATIPWHLSKRMLREKSFGGKVKARIYVEAERNGPRKIPVLEASVGDGITVMGSAHICHPSPGSHDNMSGSIALLHAVEKLKEKHEEGKFKGRFVAMWIPEYSGTISYIWEERPRAVGVANLDMVGTLSDKPMKIHRGFLINPSPLEACFVKSFGILNEMGGTKLGKISYRVCNYSNGSDHDLFNYYSVPSFMVAHVIDPMYHTSGDLPNNVDPYLIREVSVGLAMASLMVSSEEGKRVFSIYQKSLLGFLFLKSAGFEYIEEGDEGGEISEREVDLYSTIEGLEYPLMASRLLERGKISLAASFYSERELSKVAFYGGSLIKRGIPYEKAKNILRFDAAISEGLFKRFLEMITDEKALDRGMEVIKWPLSGSD